MKIIVYIFVIAFILSTEILQTDARCYIWQTNIENCEGAKVAECTDCFCYNKIFHCCSIGRTVEELPPGCRVKKVGCHEIAVKIDDENEECIEEAFVVVK